jgi:hypothetical protein
MKTQLLIILEKQQFFGDQGPALAHALDREIHDATERVAVSVLCGQQPPINLQRRAGVKAMPSRMPSGVSSRLTV